MVDDRIVRFDAAFGEHGAQVVRQRFAVAELRAEDLGGRHRLKASDAQLDAHVAGRGSQVVVERADLLAGCRQRVRKGMHLPAEGVGQGVAPFEQLPLPGAERPPVAHAALRLPVAEVIRHGEDHRQQVDQPGHHLLGLHGGQLLQPPAVDVAPLLRAFFGLADAAAFVADGGAGRHRERVGRLLERCGRRGDGKERHEGENPVVARGLVLHLDGVGHRRREDFERVVTRIVGQARRILAVFQLRAFELADHLAVGVAHRSRKALQRAVAVHDTGEEPLAGGRLPEDCDLPAVLLDEAARRGVDHFGRVVPHDGVALRKQGLGDFVRRLCRGNERQKAAQQHDKESQHGPTVVCGGRSCCCTCPPRRRRRPAGRRTPPAGR